VIKQRAWIRRRVSLRDRCGGNAEKIFRHPVGASPLDNSACSLDSSALLTAAWCPPTARCDLTCSTAIAPGLTAVQAAPAESA
jgi:hypothetical protein